MKLVLENAEEQMGETSPPWKQEERWWGGAAAI